MAKENKITREEIADIARLARLEVSPQEAEALEKDLSEIIEYFGQLSEINTAGVAVTSQVNGTSNIFREDLKRDSLPVEEIEKIAPDFATGGFRVPKVI